MVDGGCAETGTGVSELERRPAFRLDDSVCSASEQLRCVSGSGDDFRWFDRFLEADTVCSCVDEHIALLFCNLLGIFLEIYFTKNISFFIIKLIRLSVEICQQAKLHKNRE